jgi:tetratricopeptide (TPR) repeat protein
MTQTKDENKYQICSRMLDEGKYKEALVLSEEISDNALRAAILIDAGTALSKSSKIQEGIAIFENQLSSDDSEQRYDRVSLLYNAANGYSSLYNLRAKKRRIAAPTNDDNLREAKKLYREALTVLEDKSGSFASQILINYGNCLSLFGRGIEAIDYYQKALEADNRNGMAAGNLGISLEYVARLMGRHRHEYFALAHSLLTKAFSPEMHLRFGSMLAVESFQAALRRLQHFIDSHNEPILPPTPVDIMREENLLRKYKKFCVDDNLFLNAWVGDQKLSPGMTDNITFGAIITRTRDNHIVPELLRTLNEVKESFSVARYLYFLSQNEDGFLDKVSGITQYHNIDSFGINGIYTGLCKTAYARAFDVLDKIARIVNVYFNIGNERWSFWQTFAERQSRGEQHILRFVARPEIINTENYSLYALADLCIDYFESEHVDFNTIDNRRNRITHNYLTVKLYSETEKDNDDIIGLDELQQQTKRVLHLAKYATLYAVSAVFIAEAKKDGDEQLKATEISVHSKPGESFL